MVAHANGIKLEYYFQEFKYTHIHSLTHSLGGIHFQYVNRRRNRSRACTLIHRLKPRYLANATTMSGYDGNDAEQ